MTPEQIVAKINEHRTGTYAALGRKAGVSKQQVQRILTRPPNTLKTLNKLCHAVGLEIVVREKEPDLTKLTPPTMTNEQAAAEYTHKIMDKSLIEAGSHDYDYAFNQNYAAFLAGIAFAEGNKWVRVGDEPIKEYVNVLFLTENEEIFHGFVNTHRDIMEGQQGRFATKYKKDVENEITHYRYITLPAPPKPDDNG